MHAHKNKYFLKNLKQQDLPYIELKSLMENPEKYRCWACTQIIPRQHKHTSEWIKVLRKQITHFLKERKRILLGKASQKK